MPIGVMLGSAPTAGAHADLGGLRQPLGELDAHLEAHRVDEEIRDRLRLLGDVAVDARLVEGAGTVQSAFASAFVKPSAIAWQASS